MANASSTLLFRDPITGRNLCEACTNGLHKKGVGSLCRAAACKCICNDAPVKKQRTAKPDDSKLPFSGAGNFIK